MIPALYVRMVLWIIQALYNGEFGPPLLGVMPTAKHEHATSKRQRRPCRCRLMHYTLSDCSLIVWMSHHSVHSVNSLARS